MNGLFKRIKSGLTRIFSHKKRKSTRKSTKVLRTETLERRELFSINAGINSAGVLEIDGTPNHDHVTVGNSSGGLVQVTMNEYDANSGTLVNQETKLFRERDFTRIRFSGDNGDDQFTNRTHVFSRLYGGDGRDLLIGGSGTDFIYGGDGKDVLYGGAGNDWLEGELGADRVFGQLGNDWIYGGGGRDYLRGGDGNDRISGGSGKDTLLGDRGNDALYGGNNHDLLRGGSGNDRLEGEKGDDTIYGQSGDDLIRGGSGDDTLDGNSGNDRVYGGNGNDFAHGGGGSDRVYGESGSDLVKGGSGNDLVDGGDGADEIRGGRGNDTILGGSGDDTIYGGDGVDNISAGDGDDRVDGGLGIDQISGGSGLDLVADGTQGVPILVPYRGQWFTYDRSDFSPETVSPGDTVLIGSATMDFAAPGTTIEVHLENPSGVRRGTGVISLQVTVIDNETISVTIPSLPTLRNQDWRIVVLTRVSGLNTKISYAGDFSNSYLSIN